MRRFDSPLMGAGRLPDRRQFTLVVGVVALTFYGLLAEATNTVLNPAKSQTRSQTVRELKSRHLFTIAMKLPPTLELGATPAGTRRVFTVSGGQFNGDRLRGEVLPQAGSDLLLVRADGSSQQDVRLILRTDDGSLILMTYRGVRHASKEVNEKIARGEQVPPSDYYLRTAPFFETAAPKYAWLNKIAGIAVGERQPDGVTYEVFEIL